MDRYLIAIFGTTLFLFIVFELTESRYSSKTAYLDRFSSKQLDFINNAENYKIKNCKAEQIYIFLRHGARTPCAKQVRKSKDFLEAYNLYKNRKIADGVELEANTLDDIELTFADGPMGRSLTDLGKSEMRSIASRFNARYPNLFDLDSVLEDDNRSFARVRSKIDILSSDKSRSVDSAYSFINGLYENDTNLIEYLSNSVRFNNTVMRLFDECDRYMQTVKNNKSAGVELTNFEKGPEMTKLIRDFKERHHIVDMDFNPSVLRKLFTLCTIEMAHKMKENWCKIFAKNDYDILGYYNDLKSYWLKSYGYDVNSKVALLLFKDLFNHLENFIKNDTEREQPRVLLRFGHAENMIPMIATLGLFRDENHLKAENFNENLNRQFRVDNFSPFSANLAFVLHKCDAKDEKESDIDNLYKVHILINELPVNIINGGELLCNKMNLNNSLLVNDGSLCDFKHFKAQLDEYLREDLNQACTLSNTYNFTSDEKTEL